MRVVIACPRLFHIFIHVISKLKFALCLRLSFSSAPSLSDHRSQCVQINAIYSRPIRTNLINGEGIFEKKKNTSRICRRRDGGWWWLSVSVVWLTAHAEIYFFPSNQLYKCIADIVPATGTLVASLG